MQPLEGKTILIGVTGSIAAYKTPNLVSALLKLGADVHVLMTKNATEFIRPLVFETLTGHRCQVDTFARDFTFDVEHVSLAKAADLVMIAPATANVIAKLAHGLADDMLTTTVLACQCPILVAPAMNTQMYEAQITQENIEKLHALGMSVITPATGRLACKDEGIGKMPEPECLLEHILLSIGRPKVLKDKCVLVTAGPTVEAVDPVRFLTNHSTGKMGYCLARQAAMMGAKVTLISGPCTLPAPLGVETIHITSAKEMYEAVIDRFDAQDIVMKAAAVADYRPAQVASEKIKKGTEDMTHLKLERTTDILAALGSKKTHQFLCGFAMETENLLSNAKEKLQKKNADMIVANSLRTQGAGFSGDTNIVTILTKDGQKELPCMSKDDVAYEILQEIVGII